MITLHKLGSFWGLPDANPFAIKAEVLLKMANIAYKSETHDIVPALKNQVPYIDDNGTTVTDANFIRAHLETKYLIDFDKGLSHHDRATAWAMEKLCENHLGPLIVSAQWLDSENFSHSTSELFARIPAWRRFWTTNKVRGRMKNALNAQGVGQFAKGEVARLAERDFTALSAFLNNKPFLLGNTPCGADAGVFAFVVTALCPRFKSPVRAFAESHPNLRSYCGRMMRRYYHELAPVEDLPNPEIPGERKLEPTVDFS